ncbi:RmbA [Pantoea sp. AS-PWVM4]|nr:RmbA [Pantoea sp. AS-PWVM4]
MEMKQGLLIPMQNEQNKNLKDDGEVITISEWLLEMQNSSGIKYSIWPDRNYYLRVGIQAALLDKQHNHLNFNFIFVDFSHYNIKLFSDPHWISHLVKSGSGLILLSDYRMDNLASWWWKNNQRIATVIYSSDCKQTITKKIKDVLIGRWGNGVKPGSLTTLEVEVLNLLSREYTLKDIADSLGIDRKKLYNIRFSLQRKLNGEINKLFLF